MVAKAFSICRRPRAHADASPSLMDARQNAMRPFSDGMLVKPEITNSRSLSKDSHLIASFGSPLAI